MSDIKKTTTYNEDTNELNVLCGTKKAETDPTATQCAWRFDLATWTHEEIVKLAARSLTIDAQRLFRKGELKAEQPVTKADLVSERKARGPSKKAATDFLASMDPEARQAWLKEAGLI